MKALIATLIAVAILLAPAAQAKGHEFREVLPHHHWYSSKSFWVPFIVDFAAETADYATSQQSFARGGHETDSIFGGPNPSAAHMFVIGTPIAFASAYASYKLGTSRHELLRVLAPAPVAYDIVDHTYWAWHNTQLSYGHVMPGTPAAPTMPGTIYNPPTTFPTAPIVLHKLRP